MALQWSVHGSRVTASGTGVRRLLITSVAADPVSWTTAGVILVGGAALVTALVAAQPAPAAPTLSSHRRREGCADRLRTPRLWGVRCGSP
jgi:hypothetical protein